MKPLKKILFATSEEGNLGFTLLRIIMGIGLIIHGYPKMFGGIEKWKGLGGIMTKLGLGSFPVFWGFMASFAEFFGGLFLILGLFTTIFSFLIFFEMFVAWVFVHQGATFFVREPALFYFFTSFMFMVKGAGKYSIDYHLFKK